MPLPSVRFALGMSDFRDLRRGGFHYVDKTALIEDVVALGAQSLLIPRPRRFGKTLNLSTLRYYFEKSSEDRSDLFAGLSVASSDIARPHAGKYPVIFMTFKDVRPRTWMDCQAGVAKVLATVYREHMAVLDSEQLSSRDKEIFEAVLSERGSRADLVDSLRFLSRVLATHHGQKVVILIDEYDSPIHAGYANRYYDDVVAFFRDFLSSGLKDNSDLFKGVLTGILRVSRESMFSGLNNILVLGLLRDQLATHFGFTEPEVRDLVELTGEMDRFDAIRSFYNGYAFGGVAIYNPWSVLSYLQSPKKELLPYWVDTSTTELVRELLLTGPNGVKLEMETLLAGGTIEKRIDENIVLRDIAGRTDAVWSFLLFTGYLKAVSVRLEQGEQYATLAVPNTEIELSLRRMAKDWFEHQAGGTDLLGTFLAALLAGNGPLLELHLSQIALLNVSYFDAAIPEPERFYHGLVVGLLVGLGPRYEVRSNRESGFGRCDVMVSPRSPGQPGVVMELKTAGGYSKETPEKALASALKQLRERDYAAELRERGASPIHLIAAVFDGKRAYVRVVADKPPSVPPRKSASPRKGKPASPRKSATSKKKPPSSKKR